MIQAVSVVICSRGRPEDLRLTLDALRLDGPASTTYQPDCGVL